jgi:protein-tyrosine phosphatase
MLLGLQSTSSHPAQALELEQRRRLDRFGSPQSVDIHCHCVPGVDDGPQSLEEAVAVCRALVGDGITDAIATPHQFGPYDLRNTVARIQEAIDTTQAALDAESIPLRLHRGADVRVDERMMALVEKGEVPGLGPTGRYLLLELPHDAFIDLRGLIRMLQRIGKVAIITHPERHPYLVRRPEAMIDWLKLGAFAQVTCASLAGGFGRAAETAAWDWLSRGLIHLVATDAHDTQRRPPVMTQAIDLIARRMGETMARWVCLDNPTHVLHGRDLGRPPGATNNPKNLLR